MKYEDILHQGFDEISSNEKRDRMIDATIAFFLAMKSKMQSGDPEQREEAIRKTTEIQALLAARKNDLCEMTGLTPEQLDVASKHPMFGKENEAVAQAEEKLNKTLFPEARPVGIKQGRVKV